MTINNKVQLNVFGEKIEVCSCAPMTGWFRDGFCNYDNNDGGNHSICCVMAVSYTHLRAHETGRNLVCRLLLEKKKK